MSRLRILIFIFLIVISFWHFLRIDLWDYDFWWHIATGKYIVETGSLPEKDLFSYTSDMEENFNLFPERENFILKQYWLSQIIFYLTYNYAGAKGVIILRSLLYILTLIFVLWRLDKWNVIPAISFVAVFILFMQILSRLNGERPVLFTILFTPIFFFIMEDFIKKRDRRIYLLSPLMMLWANLHGGFIIGIIIIIAFMAGEGLKIILKRTVYTSHEIILFCAGALLAIGFSFANPTGGEAFDIAFSSKYDPFVSNIQEYESPFNAYYREQLYPPNYWYLSMVALYPLILVIRNRKIDLTHLIVLSGFFIMGISALRFETYYGIISAMIIGKELDASIKDFFKKRLSDHIYVKFTKYLTVAALISVIFYIAGYSLSDKPNFTLARGFSIPEKAVDFVEQNKLKGNMFNEYGYGGYLLWRLYPWKKNFVDSRALNYTVMVEALWIISAKDSAYSDEPSKTKGPLWGRLLNHYDINLIFLPLHDVYGTALSVVFKLAESDKWVPVYCNPISIIFVKNTEQNKDVIEKFKLSKDYIYNMIIYQSSRIAMANPVNPKPLVSLGRAFYSVGRLNDALTAYRYAMSRMSSPMIQEKINQVESKIKEKEKDLGK